MTRLREQDLREKVALVTGATKGIGRAVALTLASRGCAILGTCSSSASLPLIDSLQEDIIALYNGSENQPPKFVGISANLTSPDTPSVVVEAIQNHFGGRIDIFISNASVMEGTIIGNIEAQSIERCCLGNIQTPVLIIDEFVKRKMFQRESRIIFMSSTDTANNNPKMLIYGATKAAAEAMARGYANTFGGKSEQFAFMSGTTANSIFIGLVDTPFTRQFGEEAFERFKDVWLARQSLPNVAQPEEVADIVSLLCSRDARWITGSKVSANGGAISVI